MRNGQLVTTLVWFLGIVARKQGTPCAEPLRGRRRKSRPDQAQQALQTVPAPQPGLGSLRCTAPVGQNSSYPNLADRLGRILHTTIVCSTPPCNRNRGHRRRRVPTSPTPRAKDLPGGALGCFGKRGRGPHRGWGFGGQKPWIGTPVLLNGKKKQQMMAFNN